MKSKKTVNKAKTVKKKTNKIKNEVRDLNAKIDLINKELNESQDKYIRLLAEFDNFKKRTPPQIRLHQIREVKYFLSNTPHSPTCYTRAPMGRNHNYSA